MPKKPKAERLNINNLRKEENNIKISYLREKEREKLDEFIHRSSA